MAGKTIEESRMSIGEIAVEIVDLRCQPKHKKNRRKCRVGIMSPDTVLSRTR
jgi:hypothetical protein